MRIKYILSALFFSIVLSGCGLLREEVDPYVQVPVKASDLTVDVFYVKSGTDFISAYKVPNNANGDLVWLRLDESLVPTLYKGEIIALSSYQKNIQSLPVVRYKDLGFSVGLQGVTMNNGQMVFQTQNCMRDSYAEAYFKQESAKDFALLSINQEPVTQEMLDPTHGVFTCMEQDGVYTFEYYAGTYYKKGQLQALTHSFSKYEEFELKDIKETKNGYLEVAIPEDFKSGWYMINGYMFKYIDHPRDGSPEPYIAQWNEPYFKSSTTDRSYAHTFSMTLTQTTLNVALNVDVAEGTSEEATCIAVAPDGSEYTLTKSDKVPNRYSLILTSAMIGKWYVYVSPKTVNVTNVSITNAESERENMEMTHEFQVEEEIHGRIFFVEYEGTGEIFGNLIGPDGKSYPLEYDRYTKVLRYRVEYGLPGLYRIHIYYDTDINVLDIDSTDGEIDGGEDIITIEG